MSTLTIDDKSNCLLVISTFTVAPDSLDPLLELLQTNAELVLSVQDGFQGCSIAASEDGATVVNYAMWRDVHAVRAMFDNPGAREHVTAVRKLAAVAPVRYRVRHVISGE